MRLLYYTTSYYAKHGGSIQSIELYKNLNKRNEQISSIEIFPSHNIKKEIVGNHKKWNYKFYLKKLSFLQLLFFYRRNQFYFKELCKKIEDFKPDVILIQIDSNLLQIKYLKRKFPNLRICTQINGSPFDEPFLIIPFRNRFLKLQRKIYQLSDLNIFISDYLRDRIMKDYMNINRDVVIHNGCNVEKFYPITNKIELRKKLGYKLTNFHLGYVGTLDFHKKLDVLINVISQFALINNEMMLTIIGDGPAYNSLENLIRKLELENRIFLKGWVDHDQINNHLNCFDIAIHHYAHPYMNPLKVFEYLSSGVPVIAPDIPSVRKIFRSEKDLLITNGTEKDLYEKINFLYLNKLKYNELTNNHDIICKMKNDYSWTNYAQNILNGIQKIV